MSLTSWHVRHTHPSPVDVLHTLLLLLLARRALSLGQHRAHLQHGVGGGRNERVPESLKAVGAHVLPEDTGMSTQAGKQGASMSWVCGCMGPG